MSEKKQLGQNPRKKDFPESMAMGTAFTAEEMELMRPVKYAEHWYTKQQQVVAAAHRNCEKRVAAERREFALQQELDALKKSQASAMNTAPAAWTKESDVFRQLRVTESELAKEKEEKLALQQEVDALKQEVDALKQLVASATDTTRIGPSLKEVEAVNQLRAQIIKITSEKLELQAALQKALHAKDEPEVASEDEYVVKKLAELSRTKKELAKGAQNLAECEQTIQNITNENTTLKVERQSLIETNSTLMDQKLALEMENSDLKQQAQKQVVDIGSLHSFPMLTSSGKKPTDSRSTITITSDMSSSIASDMIARFERLETKILEAVGKTWEESEQIPRPQSPDVEVAEVAGTDAETDKTDPENPWMTQNGKKKSKKKWQPLQ